MTLSRILMAVVLLVGLSGFADSPKRYVVSYSVSDHGVAQMRGQALIAEDGDVSVQGSDQEGGHAFNATLNPTDDGLVLVTSLWRGETKLAEPTLAMERGGQAKAEFGGDQQRIVIEIAPAD